MLRRFLNWRRARRDRREAHDLAWLPAIAVTSDGLSTFAHSARDALMNACTGMTFEVRGTKEKFLVGKLPRTTAIVYINGDGAQIGDGPRELFWSEYQDYDSPEQLVKALLDAALDIVRSGPTAQVSGATQVQPNPSLERP